MNQSQIWAVVALSNAMFASGLVAAELTAIPNIILFSLGTVMMVVKSGEK